MERLIKNPFAYLQKIQKFANVTLGVVCLCFFMVSSCGKYEETPQELFWEIPLNSTSAVINNMVDNIEFTFCLLNEKGVPTTRFKQGENFSFHFALINHRRDKLFMNDFDLECNIENDHVGKVISLEQDTICSRFYLLAVCQSSIDPQPFYGKDNKREMTIPWNELQQRWWINENNEYEMEIFQLSPLPEGEYYTVFSPKIRFIYFDKTQGVNYHVVGPITLKINFIIEK